MIAICAEKGSGVINEVVDGFPVGYRGGISGIGMVLYEWGLQNDAGLFG